MRAAAASYAYLDVDQRPKPAIEARIVADDTPIASVVAPGAVHPRLRQRWVELARHASEPFCFAEAWFVEASLRHLDAPADMKLISVFGGPQGGMLLGMLPVHVAGPYGRMPVRHVLNWTHFHSFLGTPLVRAGFEEPFWTAVLKLLDGSDWAKGFVHVNGLVEHGPVHLGLVRAARGLRRRCPTVYRTERALLESELSPDTYYEQTVRKKKRKELKRLSARLHDMGRVEFRTLTTENELHAWIDDFLDLERSGWKGESGSALACDAATRAFFKEAVEAAHANGRLQFHRLDLDGRAVAMLVNFITPPGSFSFKIAIDERFARYSPGVLIQIENYRILERADVNWMDSCAVEDHPMINSLWGERRPIVRVTVPLAGPVRRTVFGLCRLAECTSAGLRRLKRPAKPVQVTDDE